jgi:(2R)-ethylmalonyl-CoA mutase
MSGELKVIGVNCFTESAPSPLADSADAILTVDGSAETDQIGRLRAWRDSRDEAAAQAALDELARAAAEDRNIMEASVAAAKAGVTTGEWADVLRRVYGEYRAPTGVGGAAGVAADGLAEVRAQVEAVSGRIGRRIKILVGKPGLDGHSNGAEQIAVAARDAGMEVVYEGIRLTPKQIVNAALEEAVHLVGLSILSGSHAALAREVLEGLRAEGLSDVPVVVGGIIPPEDASALKAAGVAAIYTPKDFDLAAIMADIARIVDRSAEAA